MSAVGYLAFLGWPADLCSHFRLQYSLVFLGSALFTILTRQPRLILITLLGIALNLPDLIPVFQPMAPQSASLLQAPRLKVIQMNVLVSNKDYGKAAAAIQKWSPDILSLQETSPAWLTALKPALKAYPYFLALPDETETSGRALFSRFPFKTIQPRYFSNTGASGIVATLFWQGQLITVVSLHPLPPIYPAWYHQRNAQMEGLAKLIPTLGPHLLVVGDLNNTPFSPSFKTFLAVTGLQDSRAGFGYQGSWPTFIPPLQIPIDHVLVSPDWVVLNRQVGPFTGSDHFPILVELAFSPARNPVAQH